MKAEIDLTETAVYIVQKGKKIKVTPKEHGKDVIIWKNGLVLDIERHERKRIEGQEVI